MAQDRTLYNAQIEKLKAQLIIGIEVITASSALDLNISEDKLIYACVNAQSLYLEPLIGSALTRKLQNSDLTFEYDLLIERFLEKAIINWGVAEALQGLQYSISQGGIYKHESTDSETASPNEVNVIRQSYLYKGDEFARRLIDFLNKNSTYYPEYSENSADGLNADKTAKFTGGLQIETEVSCAEGGVGDADATIFSAETYWGNTTGSTKPFDYTTLDNESSTVPSSILVQPTGNYFWLVSSVELYLAQVGTDIPMVAFDDPDANGAIFVKGEEDDIWWIRVRIADTYESAVQFDVHI